MKLFIKNTFLFSLAPIIVLVGLIIFLITKSQTELQQFEFDTKTTTLYVGDSHIKRAINDTLLSNSKNLGVNAESYYFTYYKLKNYLSANQEINKIYLGFSFHSLSCYYDTYIFGENSRQVSLHYFKHLSPSKRLRFIEWNSNHLSLYLKDLLTADYDSLNGFTVGFENEFTDTRATKSLMDKRAKFLFYTDDQLSDFSSINTEYFVKIVALCKEKNVELILVNTPMHPYYEAKIPKKYIDYYNEHIANYKLKVIDFSTLKLGDDCFLPDGDHLSYKGAKLTTEYLIEHGYSSASPPKRNR